MLAFVDGTRNEKQTYEDAFRPTATTNRPWLLQLATDSHIMQDTLTHRVFLKHEGECKIKRCMVIRC